MSDEQIPRKRRKANLEMPQTERYLYHPSDVVTLVVGPEEHKMAAHATSLTSNSDFFKAAMKKEWREGQAKTIQLLEEEPELIAEYLDFTYGKPFPKKDPNAPEDKSWYQHYNLIASLFVVGERLLDRALQNAAIGEFTRLASLEATEGEAVWLPSDQTARVIHSGTPESSPARRLLVDMYVSWAVTSWNWDIKTTPKRFAFDVMHALVENVEFNEDTQNFRHKTFRAEDYMV